MIKEIFCVVVVLLSSIVQSNKLYNKACDLVENTFVVSESRDDNIKNQAVKVFEDSETLKEIVYTNNT